MKVYTVKYKQFIPADLSTVWNFFSAPANLSKITPTEMKFETLHMTGGSTMYTGQLLLYKVSPLPFIRIRWTTEIRQVSHEQYFIDEQKFGPFALWYHQHFFFAKNGGVEMVDEVCYAVPLGFLGRLVNHLFVSRQVKSIFAFRKTSIENIFEQSGRATG